MSGLSQELRAELHHRSHVHQDFDWDLETRVLTERHGWRQIVFPQFFNVSLERQYRQCCIVLKHSEWEIQFPHSDSQTHTDAHTDTHQCQITTCMV